VTVENPKAAKIVEETWRLWRSCLRMARVMLKESEPVSWEEREQMERYYTMTPMIASKLYDDMLGNGAFLNSANENEQERRFEGMAAILGEMDRRSGEAEKVIKGGA